MLLPVLFSVEATRYPACIGKGQRLCQGRGWQFATASVGQERALDTFIPESGNEVETISSDIIDTSMFGFRAGIQGKFNRGIGFSYGVETGLRPGIQGGGFYLMGVFSVPVFGFRLNKSQTNFEN